jgi:hypothetical protein
MASIIARIEAVEEKEVSGDRTVYKATLGDGMQVATLKPEIGARLHEFVGRNARIEVTTKVTGEYTNHYVEKIEEADGEAPAQSGLVDAPSAVRKQDETAQRIARTSAYVQAAEDARSAGLPGTVSWKTVDEVLAWILEGRRPEDAA